MATITKFEDLIAWREARKLVEMTCKMTSAGALAKDFGMRDQIQRAAVSAMTNIAEGFDCESTAEFARFLGFARRSAVEVQSLNISKRKFSKRITNKPKRPRLLLVV